MLCGDCAHVAEILFHFLIHFESWLYLCWIKHPHFSVSLRFCLLTITHMIRLWRWLYFLIPYTLLREFSKHYNDVILRAMASQITSVSIASSTVCSGADQRKHQSSTSLAFVREIHRGPINSPYKGLVMRKIFPGNGVIMNWKVIDEAIFPA